MASIMIVDDDQGIRESMISVVERLGHEALQASCIEECLDTTQNTEVAVVLLDVLLPDGDGLELLPALRAKRHPPEVIVLTAHGDPDAAQTAIEKGAWAYLEKPSSVKQLSLHITRALEYRAARQASRQRINLDRTGIVGDSPEILECLELVAQAASSDADTLIVGETGTGKELFASAIHKNSDRAKGPFVVVDCAALPESLVESTLFGHVRGAFTGAVGAQEGLIRQADHGTLFLDEIGELPMGVQTTFLRVLQERRYRPVGAKREKQSDFRLVAATNRELETAAVEGKFRLDLLYRLRAFQIELPPLRQRLSDVRPLSLACLDELSERTGIAAKGFSGDFFDVLSSHEWPGNVRELYQALERAHTAAAGESILFPRHLPTHLRAQVARAAVADSEDHPEAVETELDSCAPLPSLKKYRKMAAAKAEKRYLERLLGRTDGVTDDACETSGLSRSRLYALLKKHALTSSD